MAGGRFRELMKKYGKVAIGVHLSVSAASITGLYVAIRNNVDVEAILEKFHLGAASSDENPNSDTDSSSLPLKNRTAQMAASAGGAFTLALLCNKALIPVRVPITIALTPPIARFLARRNIVKTGVWKCVLVCVVFLDCYKDYNNDELELYNILPRWFFVIIDETWRWNNEKGVFN